MCLHEKLEIINYPRPEELLNKRSELISRCRHANEFLLRNYKKRIECNPLIGKQQWIRFYVGMFVMKSLIWLKIVKYMKLKVTNKFLCCFSVILYIYIYIYAYHKKYLFFSIARMPLACSNILSKVFLYFALGAGTFRTDFRSKAFLNRSQDKSGSALILKRTLSKYFRCLFEVFCKLNNAFRTFIKFPFLFNNNINYKLCLIY